MSQNRVKSIFLASILAMFVSGSALAASSSMVLTVNEYNIVAFQNGITWLQLQGAGTLSTKLANNSLACDVSGRLGRLVEIDASVDSRLLVALYTARTLGNDIKFVVTDVGVATAVDMCKLDQVIIPAAL